MKNLSGGENEAENPIVAEFRYKFQYIHNKQQFAHIDSYQKAEDWLKEKLASEHALGVKEGRETAVEYIRDNCGYSWDCFNNQENKDALEVPLTILEEAKHSI